MCALQRRSASWAPEGSARRFTKASAASNTPRPPRRSLSWLRRLSRSTCSALASGNISSEHGPEKACPGRDHAAALERQLRLIGLAVLGKNEMERLFRPLDISRQRDVG